MRRFAIALALGLLVAAPAAADTVDVLLKNTLTLTDTQGGVTTVLISEDGKFEQTNAKGMWAAGFWTKEAGKLCITARGEATLCMPLEADKTVGDSWEIRGPTGRLAWTAQINQGRAELRSGGDSETP
ncbi:MAG: hypothetical protein Q8R02_18040 [Hyphomonadaceae bacterium]|nr:hypothetical protein [Hyphomonadaceae bacterium]